MPATGFFYYGDRKVQQPACVAEVFQDLFRRETFARVVELGSGSGGFTCILSALLPAHVPIYSYDRTQPAAALCPQITFYTADVLAVPDEITAKITAPGRTLVLCDNGDKPQEFRSYAAYLKPGDALLAHDLGSPAWPWYEISEADAAPVCDQYGLQPFHAELLREAAWLSRWRPW